MVTTRNLEYVLFIGALAIIIRDVRLRTYKFYVAIVLLALLIASDKLFLTLGAGGALLALGVYALNKNWGLVSLSTKFLVGIFSAGLLSLLGLGIVNASKVTHISFQAGLGPYGLVTTLHGLYLGLIYGLWGLLTNFGANFAYGTTIIKNAPHQALHNLLGISGFSLLVNGLVLLLGLWSAAVIMGRSFRRGEDSNKFNLSARLATFLIWTSLAALGLFIFTNHYWAADGRYLTISLFAVFISLAIYLSSKTIKQGFLVAAAVLLTMSVVLGIFASLKVNHTDKQALSIINDRDQQVAQILKHREVGVLVGDYWRVVPIRQYSHNTIKIMPLANCTQPAQVLSSTAWQPNLEEHGFAYLLSLDQNPANFEKCSFGQVINKYGKPNASYVIAGTVSQPQEIILFYDHGINHSAPTIQRSAQGPATVVPISLNELPHTFCEGPTVMNIVAHEDDDLLFMNPDLKGDIDNGRCVRTVFITAGDSGSGRFYALSRQQGSEAAYSYMLNDSNIWVHRIVKINDHQYITVANPRGDSKHSLIFLDLPDGNLKGQGFSGSNFESLTRLENGQIKTIGSVDGQSNYNLEDLTSLLSLLMHTYQPAEINTQSNYESTKFTDHSDHKAVGRLAQKAYSLYETKQFENQVVVPLRFYIGYPIHQMPENLSDSQVRFKLQIFETYSRHDLAVCQSPGECMRDPAYGWYLKREYQSSY